MITFLELTLGLRLNIESFPLLEKKSQVPPTWELLEPDILTYRNQTYPLFYRALPPKAYSMTHQKIFFCYQGNHILKNPHPLLRMLMEILCTSFYVHLLGSLTIM